MKKLIISLVLILAAAHVSLAFLGRGGEYAAEKLFYHTMKKASRIAMNPDVAPPAQLTEIERGLKLLLNKYPGTKTARIAHISLVEFYLSNKKYVEAMDMAKVIETKYAGDADILSMTQFLKGTAYEKQNNWDKALREFRALREKYPSTQLGMQIPIYIGKYYESKGLDKEAGEAYRDASEFYIKMEKEYSNKMLGYTASILLIQTYLNLEDYGSAGEALKRTLRNYASPVSFRQLLPLVERIYIKGLNDPAAAIEIYKNTAGQSKDPRLAKYLEQRIKKLETNVK